MNERKLYSKFKEKIMKADPNCFYYKIPDTLQLGGVKPFDSFLVIKGVPFAIEFKGKDTITTKYQSYKLTEFNNAGGNAFIFREGEDMDDFINKLLKIAKG